MQKIKFLNNNGLYSSPKLSTTWNIHSCPRESCLNSLRSCFQSPQDISLKKPLTPLIEFTAVMVLLAGNILNLYSSVARLICSKLICCTFKTVFRCPLPTLLIQKGPEPIQRLADYWNGFTGNSVCLKNLQQLAPLKVSAIQPHTRLQTVENVSMTSGIGAPRSY